MTEFDNKQLRENGCVVEWNQECVNVRGWVKVMINIKRVSEPDIEEEWMSESSCDCITNEAPLMGHQVLLMTNSSGHKLWTIESYSEITFKHVKKKMAQRRGWRHIS